MKSPSFFFNGNVQLTSRLISFLSSCSGLIIWMIQLFCNWINSQKNRQTAPFSFPLSCPFFARFIHFDHLSKTASLFCRFDSFPRFFHFSFIFCLNQPYSTHYLNVIPQIHSYFSIFRRFNIRIRLKRSVWARTKLEHVAHIQNSAHPHGIFPFNP